ncbi:hypothetical protein CHS0354_020748 [Potamilus streckersoni]|uniref:Novel STAND NTPase 3 domain-containing protein n=1 Tax=Potamilus streckersoni TaxID=2493646 RepID=A0AAE0SCL1_9BIVA|nr:hypothetical protein CHS0354_020748 [Potamilus streckersoni]
MAAQDPTDIVKDKEYSNWLKLTLALYYMKSGLHTFIQDEVNCLHETLVNKIYVGKKVSHNLCTICHASLAKRKNRKWTFPKNCKFCNRWFDELLALHTNSTSEKIYWNNSDVPSWPFKPWECAKVFMPRGQQPSNVGPVHCDAQALLMLLGNCKHFQPKLSLQGQSLPHAISVIRNKVIHDGEMKISDADRRNYLQQIIQLLEDPIILKSNKDCKDAVSKIRKIDNDSLDISFNLEFEMTALRSAVNECRLQLGVQEKTLDTVNSLKEEYEQLSRRLVDFENRLDTIEMDVQSSKMQTDTVLTLHGVRLDTIERDVQSSKMQTDTVLTLHGVRLDTIERDVQSSKMQTDTVLTLHGVRLDTIERDVQSSKMQTDTVLTLHGVRLDTIEENMQSVGTELQKLKTSESRNEESAELKQLKQSTENLLDTVRQIPFVPTKQAEKVRCHLQQHNWVTIQGNPGEGKTRTALKLLDEFGVYGRRVLVRRPIDWMKVDTKYVDFVFIEDIFGRFDLESNYLEEWLGYLQDIEKHNMVKLKVVITTRADILSKSLSKLGMLKFFRKNNVKILSSEKLENYEKKNMLESMLNNRTRNIDNELLFQCCQNFKGPLGFPQCCSLFSGEEDLFKKGPEFFSKPEEFFHENIKIYTKQNLLLFAFLFCNEGSFQEEIISPGPMPQENVEQLQDLAHWLGLKDDIPLTTLLRNQRCYYSGVYIERSGPCIRFTHATIYEAVGNVLAKEAPEIVIKYCSTDFLFQRMHYENDHTDGTDQICISDSLNGMLADRIISKELEKLNNERFAHFSYLNHREFVKIFSEKLSHVNKTEKFLRIESSRYMNDGNKQLDGICSTILQHCLRRNPETDSVTVMFLFDTFLKFLSCAKSCGCWKCVETQNLLELSLYYGHFDITQKLLELKAVLTPVSLCNAARHDNEKIVQFILENLKRGGKFDPREELVKMSLYRAFISGSWSVVDLLLKEGILLDIENLERTVREGNYTAVAAVIKHLKSNGHWPNADKSNRIDVNLPTSLGIPIVLKVAYCLEKYDVADLLVKEGVHVEMHMLHSVVKDCSSEAVKEMVKLLKGGNKWDPQSKWALKAMKVCTSLESFIDGQEEKVKLLCNEGMTFLSIHSLPYLVCYKPSSAKKLVQFLIDKETWVTQSFVCKVKALENVFMYERNELFELLISNGVKLTMESLPNLVKRASDESNVISTVIQHLKVHNNWEPYSPLASMALLEAITWKKKCIRNLLKREGCNISQKHLPCDLMKLVTQTSENNAGEPFEEFDDLNEKKEKMSNTDATEALQEAFMFENARWCNQLIKGGVALSTKDLFEVVWRASDNAIINIVKHLKEKKTWKANSEHASGSLMVLFIRQKTKLCDLLIEEGVTLDMSNLAGIVQFASDSVINTVINYLKDKKKLDPKSNGALHALNQAIRKGRTELCELLFREGFRNGMTDLPDVVKITSDDFIIKVINHLKDTMEWDPKSSAAFDALEWACRDGRTDLCNRLLQEGVRNSMRDLCDVIRVKNTSQVCIMEVIRYLKVTMEWDPESSAALDALKWACRDGRTDLCELLFHEGVRNSMIDLLDVVKYTSDNFIIKVINHLKDTLEWDPKSSAAIDALQWACRKGRTDLCELLFQEGVRNSMIDLPVVVKTSHDFIIKMINHLKVTMEWDPKSSAAFDALKWACRDGRTDLCDLLLQEGVRNNMRDLPDLIQVKNTSQVCIMEVIRHLKVTMEWDPESSAALDALKWACRDGRTDLCELLFQEGVRNRMIDLPVVVKTSHDFIIKVINHLKVAMEWDPKSSAAFDALEWACREGRTDLCDLLLQEGVRNSMRDLPDLIQVKNTSQVCIMEVIKHLKVTMEWDPKSSAALDTLKWAYRDGRTDLCELLFQEGVRNRMIDLPVVVKYASDDFIIKVINHLKDTMEWDPKLPAALAALKWACRNGRSDLCELLLQEGVGISMKDLPVAVNTSHDFFIKVIKHLKVTKEWNPKLPAALAALKLACRNGRSDLCELLLQEGVGINPFITK